MIQQESVRNVFETANATYNKEFGELNITICEDKSEFSTAFNLHKRLETLMVNYELFVVSTTRKDRRKLISANFNWCKYLKKTKADFISKVIFRALTNEQNHWLTRCPIEEVSDSTFAFERLKRAKENTSAEFPAFRTFIT